MAQTRRPSRATAAEFRARAGPRRAVCAALAARHDLELIGRGDSWSVRPVSIRPLAVTRSCNGRARALGPGPTTARSQQCRSVAASPARGLRRPSLAGGVPGLPSGATSLRSARHTVRTVVTSAPKRLAASDNPPANPARRASPQHDGGLDREPVSARRAASSISLPPAGCAARRPTNRHPGRALIRLW
jgi:hypothetical protein